MANSQNLGQAFFFLYLPDSMSSLPQAFVALASFLPALGVLQLSVSVLLFFVAAACINQYNLHTHTATS